jgi:nucleoside-diphosphate-sugar epimerase
VTDVVTLEAAMTGCTKCVACFGAQRVTKFSDLWTDSTQDPSHPYQINYQGVVNVVAAAKAANVEKIVRVTGLSVGYSAFDKIAILLNLVLSFTIKYQTMGERAIRESGIDYTVVRPGNMKDSRDSREHEGFTPKGPPTQLRLSASAGVHDHPVGKVTRQVRACWPIPT